MIDTFEKQVLRGLLPLHDKARLVFAILTTEKLYPNYIAFQNRFNWGDQVVLSDAIKLIHSHITAPENNSAEDVKVMIERVSAVTPDTEDFSSLLVTFALDACTSVLSSLDYILDRNIKHLTYISTYATDTVDAFIQAKEKFGIVGSKEEEKIINDPFMINEHKRQLNLLNVIGKLSDAASIESLKSNSPIIDLSLITD